jgi:hypothetical protein
MFRTVPLGNPIRVLGLHDVKQPGIEKPAVRPKKILKNIKLKNLSFGSHLDERSKVGTGVCVTLDLMSQGKAAQVGENAGLILRDGLRFAECSG